MYIKIIVKQIYYWKEKQRLPCKSNILAYQYKNWST